MGRDKDARTAAGSRQSTTNLKREIAAIQRQERDDLLLVSVTRETIPMAGKHALPGMQGWRIKVSLRYGLLTAMAKAILILQGYA